MLYNNETDLLAGLLSRNQQAFTVLYDNYSPALYGVLLRIVKDEEAANDLLQDCFVKVWINIGRYEASKGLLFTWMLHICRNTAFDYLKAQRNKPPIYRLSDEKTEFVVTHKFAYNVLPVDSIGISDLVNRLDENHRECIDLYYFQGYTDKQVAERLNTPLGTTKTRIMRGLQKLRRYLNGELYDCA